MSGRSVSDYRSESAGLTQFPAPYVPAYSSPKEGVSTATFIEILRHIRRRKLLIASVTTLISAAALVGLRGFTSFLSVQVPVTLTAASIGVWLFYVQHQFEDTHWSEPPDWSVHEAALHGSSHYDLPPVLRWFTANVGIHHVHHLVSRIPFYRLGEVLRTYPEMRDVGRLSIWQSFRCVRLVLWDADRRRLVAFTDLDS